MMKTETPIQTEVKEIEVSQTGATGSKRYTRKTLNDNYKLLLSCIYDTF
jgi:hypothetical protein